MRWQVQEAKQHFSEVLRAALAGEPQIVTRHGEEIAVIVEIAEFHRLRGEVVEFMDFLVTGPLLDIEVDLQHRDGSADRFREVDLAAG